MTLMNQNNDSFPLPPRQYSAADLAELLNFMESWMIGALTFPSGAPVSRSLDAIRSLVRYCGQLEDAVVSRSLRDSAYQHVGHSTDILKEVEDSDLVWKDVRVGDSTYQIAVDDGCLVVRPNNMVGGRGGHKVWLSRGMIEWLSKHGLVQLDGHVELPPTPGERHISAPKMTDKEQIDAPETCQFCLEECGTARNPSAGVICNNCATSSNLKR